MSASELNLFAAVHHLDLYRRLELYDKLKQMGFLPWMDTPDMLGGEEWAAAIERTISTSDFAVFCLSSHSSEKRGYLRKELKMAQSVLDKLLRSDIFIIPVFLEKCKLPEELAHLHTLDLFQEGGMSRLETSIREGALRRPRPNGDERKLSTEVATHPFDEEAVSTIVGRVGVDNLTPRMLNTACGGLLMFAADDKEERITAAFVKRMWGKIGAQVLATEGDIERLARLVKHLMAHDGKIDEDSVSLESLLEMLGRGHGGFGDLLDMFGPFEDVFQIEDRDGSMQVLLSPLIDKDFVRNVFLKKSTDEFRQEFQRKDEDPPEAGSVVLIDPELPSLPGRANHNARSVAALLRDFRKSRAELVRQLEAFPDSMSGHAALHPRLKMPMNVVDLAYFVAEHDDYHLTRISELLRSDKGYAT